MKAAAVFDLDGTLVAGTSAERLLAPYLVRRGVVGWRQLISAAALAVTLPVKGRTVALRRNKRWLAGVEVERVEACLPAFVTEVLEARWSLDVVERMKSLRDQGIAPHLITGAPDFIARVVGRRFGMASCLGTALEERNGRYTGRLAGSHVFAKAKVEAVHRLAEEWELDLGACYGFADHASDVAFLDCFGFPVAVAPDKRLRKTATRRGWEVMEGAR